jgi:hypothetical protein
MVIPPKTLKTLLPNAAVVVPMVVVARVDSPATLKFPLTT